MCVIGTSSDHEANTCKTRPWWLKMSSQNVILGKMWSGKLASTWPLQKNLCVRPRESPRYCYVLGVCTRRTALGYTEKHYSLTNYWSPGRQQSHEQTCKLIFTLCTTARAENTITCAEQATVEKETETEIKSGNIFFIDAWNKLGVLDCNATEMCRVFSAIQQQLLLFFLPLFTVILLILSFAPVSVVIS